jgi:hypothetical protein
LTERICVPLHEGGDIDLEIFLHFQFWNYGEVVKLQQSKWVFFMGSLMAIIDMKALAILED